MNHSLKWLLPRSPKKDRAGEAELSVWPLKREDAEQSKEPVAAGKAAIGKKVKAGAYYLAATEVRYWVGMSVHYEPGQPIVFASMWVGLGGMIITFFCRMRRGSRATVSV